MKSQAWIFLVGVFVNYVTGQQPWPMPSYPMQRFPTSYLSDNLYPPTGALFDQQVPFNDPYQSYQRPLGYDYQAQVNTPFGGNRAYDVAMASLISYVYDKDNFQPHGCGWDPGRNRCTDILNQCKGMCRDFANDVVTHDCRCVPFGYAALLGWGKRR